MNCAEFQKVLPYIIETGGNAEEEAHLRSCAVCSDLVQDLKYIAEQAKLVVPMHTPPTRVWAGIRTALEREGLVRPVAGTARFRPAAAEVLTQRRWASGGGLVAFAALLLLGVGILWFRNGALRQPDSASTNSSAAPAVAATSADLDDTQVLELVKQRAPAMLTTYRDNLESVNTYIRDARRSVEENPNDVGVRDHLIRAYDEKALLYEMALSRSLD
jgi:hypothetical protein